MQIMTKAPIADAKRSSADIEKMLAFRFGLYTMDTVLTSAGDADEVAFVPPRQ